MSADMKIIAARRCLADDQLQPQSAIQLLLWLYDQSNQLTRPVSVTFSSDRYPSFRGVVQGIERVALRDHESPAVWSAFGQRSAYVVRAQHGRLAPEATVPRLVAHEDWITVRIGPTDQRYYPAPLEWSDELAARVLEIDILSDC